MLQSSHIRCGWCPRSGVNTVTSMEIASQNKGMVDAPDKVML